MEREKERERRSFVCPNMVLVWLEFILWCLIPFSFLLLCFYVVVVSEPFHPLPHLLIHLLGFAFLVSALISRTEAVRDKP